MYIIHICMLQMAGGHEGPLQTSKCHKHANSISHWGTEKCDGIK